MGRIIPSKCGDLEILRDSLENFVSTVPGEVGIAVIVNGCDTVTVNDYDVYPLMSVFKLHQAVALCRAFDINGTPLDTLITVERDALNHHTWSPMLKDIDDSIFRISARDLMLYAIRQSDNNASNLIFERFLNVPETDKDIATLIPRDSYSISVSEAAMYEDHEMCYSNHSSPLSTAILVDRLFTDSIVSPDSRFFICEALRRCSTGMDRISAPLADIPGLTIAHKTGSGYIDAQGRLMAHNDAAHIAMSDGRFYTLVVFVKDFAGGERDASRVISRISEITYQFIR